MADGRPDIAVVVPTYQRPDVLAALLGSLAVQTLDPARFEVIVVDDCSEVDVAGLVERLGAPADTWRVLRTPHNAGPAVARNLGWRSTEAPIVAFLDDDCMAEPGWLAAGLGAMERQPEVGVLQGRTEVPRGVSFDRREDWWVWRVVEQPEPEFMACNIFYRRAALEAGGGFDETIGWWGEDTSAGWRVIDAGWGRGYADDAVAVHPIERRGWMFFVRNGWREHNMVKLGVAHPGYRAEKFWRPWAYRREGPEFVIALVGLALGRRHHAAPLLALPYLWHRRPSVRRLSFFRLCVQIPVVDAVRVASHVRGSIASRTFVL